MERILYIVAEVINWLHDVIVMRLQAYGLQLNDKDLHFYIIGAVGILIFIMADLVFKYLAKWSVSAISFIYTFTLLVVVVFGLEIQQGITGRGAMEFADIVAGLWGFLAMFAVFAVVRGLVLLVYRVYLKKRRRRIGH